MARKSTASLSVVQVGVRVRLPAPADLTPEQAALWTAAVESKPIDWFAEDSSPLLKEYVRACCMTDWMETQVQAAMVGADGAALGSFMKLRDMESKRVASMATKLRLTQQSRYTPAAAATADKKAGSGGKPWQFGGK
ncbi:MAG TPA: hypothetical protein VMV87_01230 [Burkholderiales bacterium]|nr:hypothetical protein [Burkholderiales bacterium]